MAAVLAITERDFAYLVTATAESGRSSAVRDVALLYVLFLTGLMPSEIAALKVSDYRDRHNKPLSTTQVKAEIAFNAKERHLYWLNPKMVTAIDAYLSTRHRVAQDSPLFLSKTGQGFTFRVTVRNGVTYHASGSLTNLYNKLFMEFGLPGVNTSSARKTLATWLYQRGAAIEQIRDLLGLADNKATRKLIEGVTPPPFERLLKTIV